jgi:hypothetical protein
MFVRSSVRRLRDCDFRLRSVLATEKIANNSRTVAARREMSTDYQKQTMVCLSNGQVTLATRRHLAAVSASGPI